MTILQFKINFVNKNYLKMEGTTKDKLNEELKKFEDWYKAVIFDTNCEIIASKNCEKIQDGELK